MGRALLILAGQSDARTLYSVHPSTWPVIAVVGDTHGRSDHRLEGRTLKAVRAADLVVHAGDLATSSVLEAFKGEATALLAVKGNNDPADLDLPIERVVDHDGVRLAVVHGHRHTGVAASMYAREVEADILVVGHSHNPGFSRRRNVPVVNPGSHAHPRWYRPAHAELEIANDRIDGRLVEPDGTVFETISIDKR